MAVTAKAARGTARKPGGALRRHVEVIRHERKLILHVNNCAYAHIRGMTVVMNTVRWDVAVSAGVD